MTPPRRRSPRRYGRTALSLPTTHADLGSEPRWVGGEAHIPFGGMKATGVGLREMGSVAIDFYTELKVVYVDYTGGKRSGNLY